MPKEFPASRREAVLLVTPDLLVEMIKPGAGCVARVIKNAVPLDARVERVGHGPTDGFLRVVLSSTTFDPIHDGEPRPELPAPLIQLIYARELADEARAAAELIDVTDAPAATLLRRVADLLDPRVN